MARIKIRQMTGEDMGEGTNVNEEMEIDLAEVFSVLLRKWWLILLSLILGAGLALGYTKVLVTPKYEASSMIYILGKSTGDSINVQLSKQLTLDFITLAKSRPVIEDAINELGLDMTYEEVSDMIEVENPTDTSILKATAVSTDPKLAKDLSNAMAGAMAERIKEVMATDKPSVVEKAVLPKEPVTPNTTKNVMLGGLLGAILVMGILIIRFMMDDRIKDQDDVEKYLQLNVLAIIPLERKR